MFLLANKRESRTRSYACVVYPDSAPGDWLERLSDLHICALVSPLHDKDVNPDGEIKKPHYHVLLLFESVKTQKQADEVIKEIGGVGHENVGSTRGYARYLIHLDNPEKYQYNASDVKQFGGADFFAIIHLPTDDLSMQRDIIDYIVSNHIYSYAQLVLIAKENNDDWFNLLMRNSYSIREFIKSFTWEETSKNSFLYEKFRNPFIRKE